MSLGTQAGPVGSPCCQPAPGSQPSPLLDSSPWSHRSLQPEAPRATFLAGPRPPPKAPALKCRGYTLGGREAQLGREGGEPPGRVAAGGQCRDVRQDKRGQPSPGHKGLSVRDTPSPVCNRGGSGFLTRGPFPDWPRCGLPAEPCWAGSCGLLVTHLGDFSPHYDLA